MFLNDFDIKNGKVYDGQLKLNGKKGSLFGIKEQAEVIALSPEEEAKFKEAGRSSWEGWVKETDKRG